MRRSGKSHTCVPFTQGGGVIPRDSEPTRRRLIATAERLFAERGIGAVSIREINVAAGQHNASALHYHFGSREGLLQAVLSQHVAAIRDRRLALLAELRADGVPDLRTAARVLVEPPAEPLQAGPSGRAFLRILPQVLTDPTIGGDLVHVLFDQARQDGYKLLTPYLSWLPTPMLRERIDIAQLQATHAVAARAHVTDQSGTVPSAASHALFVATLCDMFVGSVTGPVSAEAIAALAAAESEGATGTFAELTEASGRTKRKEQDVA